MDDTRIFRWYPPSRIEGEERVTPGFWVPIVTVHEPDLLPVLVEAIRADDPGTYYRESREWPSERPDEPVVVIPKEYKASQKED